MGGASRVSLDARPCDVGGTCVFRNTKLDPLQSFASQGVVNDSTVTLAPGMSTGFADGAARTVGQNLVTQALNYALGPACPSCHQHLKTIATLESQVSALQREGEEKDRIIERLERTVEKLVHRVDQLEERVKFLEADNARLRRLCRKYGVDPEEDPDAGVPVNDGRFDDVCLEL